jgi:hypothetical protein
MQWINKMDDGNPRKWYLKGILAAVKLEKDKKEEPLIVTGADDGDADDGDDGQFYRWSPEKLAQYQADQWDDPKKAKALEEYNAKLLQYKKEHNDEEPPLAPAAAEKTNKATTAVNVDKFKGIPQYLGYFQHAFDLDATKTYFRYYHAESNVTENLRKQYKYRLKNRELYREMFTLLKKRDESFSALDDADDKKDADDKSEDSDEEKKEEPAA